MCIFTGVHVVFIITGEVRPGVITSIQYCRRLGEEDGYIHLKSGQGLKGPESRSTQGRSGMLKGRLEDYR